MKKIFLLVIASLLMINSKSMENPDSLNDEQKQAELKVDLVSKYLFGIDLANEIIELIFEEANHRAAEKIIRKIAKFVQLIDFPEDWGYTRCYPEFEEIFDLIRKAPPQTYTRIALWLLFCKNFSHSEMLNFLVEMLQNPRVRPKAKLILDFLISHIGYSSIVDLKESSQLKKNDNAKLILKFLNNYHGSIPIFSYEQTYEQKYFFRLDLS